MLAHNSHFGDWALLLVALAVIAITTAATVQKKRKMYIMYFLGVVSFRVIDCGVVIPSIFDSYTVAIED